MTVDAFHEDLLRLRGSCSDNEEFKPVHLKAFAPEPLTTRRALCAVIFILGGGQGAR
jgi:hypothetical protein